MNSFREYGRRKDSRRAAKMVYQWTVISTTWNHLRVQWQGQQEEAVKQQTAAEDEAKVEAEEKRIQEEEAKQQSAAEVNRTKEEMMTPSAIRL
jgi:membrane protein involved in colicin uptake